MMDVGYIYLMFVVVVLNMWLFLECIIGEVIEVVLMIIEY